MKNHNVITEYNIVHGTDPMDVQRAVRRYIEIGFQPHKGLVVTSNGWLYQAMVKYATDADPSKSLPIRVEESAIMTFLTFRSRHDRDTALDKLGNPACGIAGDPYTLGVPVGYDWKAILGVS